MSVCNISVRINILYLVSAIGSALAPEAYTLNLQGAETTA